jgi:hypothetical protein
LDNILALAESSVIIDNAEQTSQILMQTAERLKLLSDNLIKQASDMKLPEFVQKVYLGYDSTIANTNKMINNVGYRTESTIFSLQETLEELRKTSKSLRNTLNSINESPSTIFLTSPPPIEK